MNNEKILEILKDKGFAEKILKMQTPEQVQVAFKEKGVEISADEVKIIGSILNKMVEKKTINLSEEDLNEIAGGDGIKGFAKGLGEGAIDVPLSVANLVTGQKYYDTIEGANPLRDKEKDDSNDTADVVGRGLGAASAMVIGAGILMGTGIVAGKGVKWGINKLKKKK